MDGRGGKIDCTRLTLLRRHPKRRKGCQNKNKKQLTVLSRFRTGGADKEAETKRIVKELANIRAKFSASTNLSSYQKKKYVWKLVYIFMLGHEVDFGHMEVMHRFLSVPAALPSAPLDLLIVCFLLFLPLSSWLRQRS